MSNVISLYDISRTIHSGPEHPLARKVGYTLHMRSWRERARAAATAHNYSEQDALEREWEMIHAVY